MANVSDEDDQHFFLAEEIPKTAEEKLMEVWKTLETRNEDAQEENKEWPPYEQILASTLATDYNQILQCPMDFISRNDGGGNNKKAISPHGVVCRARLELFPNENTSSCANYTGGLTPGSTWNQCLLRLSSAIQPPTQAIQSAWVRSILYATGEKLRHAQLFPASALKLFLDDDGSETTPTKNVLFGGSKIGQRETDYFAHCQATMMTERMPTVLKPFVKKFWEYSDYPLSLGLSDFCRDTDKTKTNSEKDLNFPFALIIKPKIQSTPCEGEQQENGDEGDSSDEEGKKLERRCSERGIQRNVEKEVDVEKQKRWSRWASFNSSRSASTVSTTEAAAASFDSFLDFCLNEIPEETHLFDLYACPTPQAVVDPSQLQRIGRIVTTSKFIASSPKDGLFFKHQVKEDDYALRPDWPEALKQPATELDEGKVKGTIGTLAGWKLFQQQINKKLFVDFEKKASN